MAPCGRVTGSLGRARRTNGGLFPGIVLTVLLVLTVVNAQGVPPASPGADGRASRRQAQQARSQARRQALQQQQALLRLRRDMANQRQQAVDQPAVVNGGSKLPPSGFLPPALDPRSVTPAMAATAPTVAAAGPVVASSSPGLLPGAGGTGIGSGTGAVVPVSDAGNLSSRITMNQLSVSCCARMQAVQLGGSAHPWPLPAPAA
jgi:hypothetical protein